MLPNLRETLHKLALAFAESIYNIIREQIERRYTTVSLKRVETVQYIFVEFQGIEYHIGRCNTIDTLHRKFLMYMRWRKNSADLRL